MTCKSSNNIITLRPYQREAVDSVYAHLRSRDDNPCVVIPTGAGKTYLIAEICRDAVQRWGGRVVVLAHVRELLEQSADKLRAVAGDLPVGICSAGLGRRDTSCAITVAGIQSVYQRAHDLGPLDLVIVDEAHLIPPDGEGMYRRFLSDAHKLCDHQRVVGLTATPFRMKSGSICAPEHILNHICCEVGVRELIAQGYLSPLRSRAGKATADTSGLHVRAGEFIPGEVEDLMDTGSLVDAACAEIIEQTINRKATLIFAAGVRHGMRIARTFQERHGIECGFVCGDTPAQERDTLISRFKSGDLKYLANVNVLTTGFDSQRIDCVAMLRPTLSPGLYYQMVGRGFRLAPGKTDCLVLDYGCNVLRHGPVDAIRIQAPGQSEGEAHAKQCPQCRALIATGYATCPECGHVFSSPKPQHESHASTADILSGDITIEDHDIIEVSYNIHYKRGDPLAKPTMRVEYRVAYNQYISEWVCFEHQGYARIKAEKWWRARSSEPVPDTVEEAVEMACAGALAPTIAITTERRAGEQYDRIVAHRLTLKPPRLESEEGLPEYSQTASDTDEWEVPF